MKGESSAKIWIAFLGLLFLLLGIFAAARTAANIALFKDKYPQGGVVNLNFSGQPAYFSRESDCNYPPTVSYSPEGKPMEASAEQKKIDEQNKANCLAGVKDARETARINDIATSVLFLFVGVGILTTRRFFFA